MDKADAVKSLYKQREKMIILRLMSKSEICTIKSKNITIYCGFEIANDYI